MTDPARKRFIFLASASYAVLALAWIFLSDQLLAAFGDLDSVVWLSTAKGVFFVVTTTGFLFLALRAVPPAAGDAGGPLLDALARSLSPGWLPAWGAHVFALFATLAMLVVRDSLAVPFGERPLLILFMFPVILSALLGGLGPGLVATAAAALGVAFLAIPPVHSLRIGSSHDLLQWGFLVANGVAVSLLSEGLRRSLAKAEFSRRLLDTVVGSTPDAVFVKDRQGRYLLVNAAAAGFVGKQVQELVGRDDRYLFPAPLAQDLMEADRAIMASGTTQTGEEQLTTLDGQELVFLVSKGPVLDDEGRAFGTFGVAHEITARKRAEQQIHRLNGELEQRVAERTAELQSANLELEELAYALTHNLRAPLRAIDGFSQVLLEEHADRLDTGMKACLAQITRANRSMGEQLDGILTLLRCTRGELQREWVDVSALARRRFDELARLEPQRTVAVRVDAGLAAVGDAAMLGLVVTELLDNAWKFSRNRAAAAIRVEAGEAGGRPAICVIDNGAGFDMAHAERLFQPFQRLHRQDEFPGVGIGLAAVRRIVRRHGGDIRASAVAGAGATFSLSLPGMAANRGGDA